MFLVFYDSVPYVPFDYSIWQCVSHLLKYCYFLCSFILTLKLFGRKYYCYWNIYWCSLTKEKSYKQMIVMLTLVLIDAICIVSFAVYGSTCVMWDCTYVLWVVEIYLYITSCVWIYHSSFCTSDILVNVNLFFFFF